MTFYFYIQTVIWYYIYYTRTQIYIYHIVYNSLAIKKEVINLYDELDRTQVDTRF